MDVFYINDALTPHLTGLMGELGLINGAPYTLAENHNGEFSREAFDCLEANATLLASS